MTVDLRHPTPADAHLVLRIVRDSHELHPNSPYAHLVLFEHFAETCVVASLDRVIVGFVTGYRPPSRPEVLFVWQIGVHERHRGHGIATAMMLWLVHTRDSAGVRLVEATVPPLNEAPRRTFVALARALRAECTVVPGFAAELVGQGRESEELYRVGPIDRSTP